MNLRMILILLIMMKIIMNGIKSNLEIQIKELFNTLWKIDIIIRFENFSNRMLQVLKDLQAKQVVELMVTKWWTSSKVMQNQWSHQNKEEVIIDKITLCQMLLFWNKKKSLLNKRQCNCIKLIWKNKIWRIKKRKSNSFYRDKISCLN